MNKNGPSRVHKGELQGLKRLAIQVAAQLPQDPGKALLVLSLTEMLVRSFLGDCPTPLAPEGIDLGQRLDNGGA